VVSLPTVSCDVAVFQKISVEEQYGSGFMYEVLERRVGSNVWEVVDTVPAEKSSFTYTLRQAFVELSVISRNEIGNTIPSTAFTIFPAALCSFSCLF